MAQEAFAGVRVRLEQERASLRSDIAALAADNQAPQDDAGIGNHMADDATEVFARERDLALRSNARDLLVQVQAAIERMDEGRYGTCARCGQAASCFSSQATSASMREALMMRRNSCSPVR